MLFITCSNSFNMKKKVHVHTVGLDKEQIPLNFALGLGTIQPTVAIIHTTSHFLFICTSPCSSLTILRSQSIRNELNFNNLGLFLKWPAYMGSHIRSYIHIHVQDIGYHRGHLNLTSRLYNHMISRLGSTNRNYDSAWSEGWLWQHKVLIWGNGIALWIYMH